MKEAGESFSDVVNRLTGTHLLSKVVGRMDTTVGEKMKRDIAVARRRADEAVERGSRRWLP